MKRLTTQLCVRTVVPRFSAHRLRHTFGTEAASSGIPETELQALLGHENLSTTQRYVRATGRDPERTMAGLKVWWEARDSARQDVESPVRTREPLP